ncbi:DUF1501 domain-containing protein [Emticicia sp. CRIBPO]|uniref:DUF1501 domain-containing protein n=1 Tax=Emticicia sp. CRIBPO TaxID=2683258 RepID=UPI0014134995|nr:DUF1501 domain-containing protein [Emticicia sp. CRIBPO]NBA87329.1 DUF1501 domain-containing protein [Emticicia sp. CRIBPO]
MDRRKFIQQSSLGLGVISNFKVDKMEVSAFQPEVTATENDNVLVVIQLFGGNDGINTITPYEWDRYYNDFRPQLHIPQSAVTPISKEKGLAMHPSLKVGVNEGILGLHKAGKLSIIQGVGYDIPSYSHFRSTDIWFSGIVPANDGQLLRTGWMGRYFDRYDNQELPESPYCIHIGKNPSLMFQGDKSEKAILVEDPEEFFNQGKVIDDHEIENQNASYFSSEFDYINNIGVQVNHYSKSIKKAFDAGKNIESYVDKSLSNQMKLVARLIDGGLKTKVFFVELFGFDTHAGQGGLDGVHSRLLAEVSEAIGSFQSDIEKLGFSKKVIGITVSEFGRRPYENGSMGTDHGTSNVMFAFGDEVKGEIFGSHMAFVPFRDHENLYFRYDYRSIYWEILRTWFGATSEYAEKVLGGKFALVDEKGFIGKTVIDKTLPPPPIVPVANNNDPKSPNNPNNPANITEQDYFQMFPNPVVDNKGVLSMVLYAGGSVTITQNHISGQGLGEIHVKNYRPGSYVLPIELRGGPGMYILHIRVTNRNHFLKILKI